MGKMNQIIILVFVFLLVYAFSSTSGENSANDEGENVNFPSSITEEFKVSELSSTMPLSKLTVQTETSAFATETTTKVATNSTAKIISTTTNSSTLTPTLPLTSTPTATSPPTAAVNTHFTSLSTIMTISTEAEAENLTSGKALENVIFLRPVDSNKLNIEYLKSNDPALCSVGSYGRKCLMKCQGCLGSLCSSRGSCYFGFVTDCHVTGCYQDADAGNIQNLQLIEEVGSIFVNFSYPSSYTFRPGLWIIYWNYFENKFTVDIVFSGFLIPIIYRSFYIVCASYVQDSLILDVECKTININYRCIRKLDIMVFNKKYVSWKAKEGDDLFQYRIDVTFQRGACGIPIHKVQSFNTTNTIFEYPNLKGQRRICVFAQKRAHDPFCDAKKSCRSFVFTPEVLEVEDFKVEDKGLTREVTWTVPQSWETNCNLILFKARILQGASIHKESKVLPCPNRLCMWSISLLQNGYYTLEVIPIFENSIEGVPSRKSIEILHCPRAVTNVTVREVNENLLIRWKDTNIFVNYYSVSIAKLQICKYGNETWTKKGDNVKEATFPKVDRTFLGIHIEVEPIFEGCARPTHVHTTFVPPTETVSMLLENFKASFIEYSLHFSWKIPQQWKQICIIRNFVLKRFKVTPIRSTYEDLKTLQESSICNALNCNYVWNGGDFTPHTKYIFSVHAVFTNNLTSNVSLTTVETPEEYPTIPKNALTIYVKGNIFSIRNNFQNYWRFLLNMYCEISFIELDSLIPNSYDCFDGYGTFKNEDFEKGKHYQAKIIVCNLRGCNSYSPFKFWTPPEKPKFREKISFASSGNNVVTLKFPSFGHQTQGRIYIVVVKGNTAGLKRKNIEDFVKNYGFTQEHSSRFRRSIDQDAKPFNLSVADTVNITTKEYELDAGNVFGENETRSDISVAAVYVLEAGEFKSYGSTDIVGPIRFSLVEPEGDPDMWLIWLLVCLLVLSSCLVGLSIYQRRRLKLSFRDMLRIKIPAPEGESSTQERTSFCSKEEDEEEEESSRRRRPMRSSSITESALALSPTRDDDVRKSQSSLSLQEMSMNLNQNHHDDTAPECDGCIVVEPNRSYVEDLEFFLIQASHSPSLEQEFVCMPTVMHGKTMKEGVRSENRLKNRYQNNIPYDDTRVVLPKTNVAFSDYINASIIQITAGPNGEYATYIPTQGPLQKGGVIFDFWRMVWYENVSAIVMLTNLIENNKAKCDQYWSDEGEELDCKDGILVTNLSVEIRNSYIIRTLSISKDTEVREVIQYHYTEWPDHGVPVDASPIANMINLVRFNHPYGPTVVHCSAGIGRTGCFILVVKCLEEYQLYNPIDLKRSLLYLRKRRPRLVQNFRQYQFSFYLLWVILFESTTTYLTNEFAFKWQNTIQNLDHEDSSNPQALSKQFQKLKTFQKELTYYAAMDKQIRYKYNRFRNILPADSKRVSLISLEGLPEHMYINAIMIDGFCKKDCYIVAEHPMNSTIDRIWFMILERQIPVWILLNDMSETYDEDTYPTIVPSPEEPSEFGHLRISLLSSTSHEFFVENWIKIEGKFQENEIVSFECRVIQLLGWMPSSIAPEAGPDPIFSMLDYVHSGGTYNCPLLFTCADGYTACGTALALDISRQRSDAFGEVSIFSSCIRLVYCRPEFIVSLEQYRLLHEYLASYLLLSEQEIYENIEPT